LISSEEEFDEDHISDEEFDEEEEFYGGEEDIDRFILEEIKPQEEDGEENRFRILTTLFFAIVGATILGILSPITAGENANELYWWTPLIGAFIGAIIGAFFGLIVDAFYTATRKDTRKEEEKSSMEWSEDKV